MHSGASPSKDSMVYLGASRKIGCHLSCKWSTSSCIRSTVLNASRISWIFSTSAWSAGKTCNQWGFSRRHTHWCIRVCSLSDIQATESVLHASISRRHQKYFNHKEVKWLSEVYKTLYPSGDIGHVAMVHEQFHELAVFGEKFLSDKARGKHSAVICAYWSFMTGRMTSEHLRFGNVICFFRHKIHYNSKELTLIFARIHWFKQHPKNCWFNHRIAVVDPDLQCTGPSKLAGFIVDVQW